MPDRLPIHDIAESIDDAFHSRNFGRNGLERHPVHDEEPNVVGGLFAIATALNRVADAIEGHGR